MNTRLFIMINSLTGQYQWLDRFMIFSANWLGYFLILLLLTPLFATLFIKNNRLSSLARSLLLRWSYYKEMLLVALSAAVVSRFIFVSLIRYFYYNPRPFLVLPYASQLIDHETTSSLPSGHAAFYFALAMGVYLYNKKAGYAYLASAGLIGFARIFVGVHWPLDIIFGAVLGIITALLLKILKQKMPRRALIFSSQ